VGSPLSHTHEQQRAKQSGGKESGEEGQESEPALISVIFSFLLHLSEGKYHWSKSGKGEKTVNLLIYYV